MSMEMRSLKVALL